MFQLKILAYGNFTIILKILHLFPHMLVCVNNICEKIVYKPKYLSLCLVKGNMNAVNIDSNKLVSYLPKLEFVSFHAMESRNS